jgi:hypothetical protein
VLVGELLADLFQLIPVGQVGGDAFGLAVSGERFDGVVDVAGILAMRTALPPRRRRRRSGASSRRRRRPPASDR